MKGNVTTKILYLALNHIKKKSKIKSAQGGESGKGMGKIFNFFCYSLVRGEFCVFLFFFSM